MRHGSRRIPGDLSPNRLAETRRRIGEITFDLTVSNPTACGISYPEDLLAGLGHPRGLKYEADPFGPIGSRTAVAAWYERYGARVDPERIFLTASTSEAYSFLFRMLCDPGDAVLVPAPSYPLFDHLARLDCVEARRYELDVDGEWRLDFSTMENAPETVRALVVVHPNNPTGSYIHPDDAERLVAMCRDRGWALIADEVFLPYPLEGGAGKYTTFAAVEDCLCFALGGLSKSIGLPQLKLAWIVANGPDEAAQSACASLEWVADAYLSVSIPLGLATSDLLSRGESVREKISARCTNNLRTLRDLVRECPSVAVGPVGGGWSAVLRVPAVMEDEELCVLLLETQRVALLPGLFFDFPRPGYLVVSLLPPEEIFRAGMTRALPVIGDTDARPGP